MVKLTAELIEQAAQYTNAVRDRELDLRGTSREVSGPTARSPVVPAPPRARRAGAWPAGLHCGRQAPPGAESCRCYPKTIPWPS